MAAINIDKTCSMLPISTLDCQESSLLTDCDINEILERKFGGNFRLVDWRLESLDKTKGFLGQYYHLHILAQIDGKTQSLRLFAKTPPPTHSPQFEFLQRYDTFNKEITVYTDLVRRMGVGGSPKWMVEYYFCKRNVIIVLEDASIDGYATPNKYVPFDEEHCVWLLRTLSRLHSRSLILDERLRREDDRTIFDLYGRLLNEVLFVEGDDRSERALASSITGLCAMIDFVEELDGKEKVIVKRRFIEWSRKISRLLAPSKEHRNVLCHRDIWANNIMFRHDLAGNTNGCYIIDWQFLCYCPPAIDFTFCLYLNTNRSTRDRHFDVFAKIYHDSLARELAEEGFDIENCLSWMAFQKSYAEARNIALIYAALNLQVMLLSSETTAKYFCTATDKLEQVLYGDERAELVYYQCEKMPAYKTRIFEILCEIKDRLPDHLPSHV
ncbi:hypothetical protein P5V15_005325 [Pogonomyrmex californicus]